MLRIARREPSAVLLAVQLGAVLLYPFMEDSDAGRALFSVFGIGVLGLVLLAVRSTPARTWFGVLLAVPATVLLLIQAVTGDDALLPYSSALESVLYFYAALALIAYMLEDHEITRDELFAVGATFTLGAWALRLPVHGDPGDRAGQLHRRPRPHRRPQLDGAAVPELHDPHEHRPQRRVPVKASARSVVMIEQVAGLAYVAMVVSRLVALTVLGSRGMDRREG